MSTPMIRPMVCDRHEHVDVSYDAAWMENCPLCDIVEAEIDPDDCDCRRVHELERNKSNLEDEIEPMENKIVEFESIIEALDEVITEASELAEGDMLPDDIAEKQTEAIDKLVELIAKAKAI